MKTITNQVDNENSVVIQGCRRYFNSFLFVNAVGLWSSEVESSVNIFLTCFATKAIFLTGFVTKSVEASLSYGLTVNL